MSPACVATTAMLIASAVSSGGVVAVWANKLRAITIARMVSRRRRQGSNPEQVNLMPHLYDSRRAAKLREAREWPSVNFHPESPDGAMRLVAGREQRNPLSHCASYAAHERSSTSE